MKIEDINCLKKIVTHKNCPDGMATAIIIKDALPDIEVIFVSHGTEEYLTMPATEGMVYCDITPPPNRAPEFVDAGTWVLDHHITAKKVVSSFGERGVYSDEAGVSGAVLALKEIWEPVYEDLCRQACKLLNEKYVKCDSLATELVNRFATLAGIRDTWQINHKDFQLASEYAAALTFFTWDYWESLLDDGHLITKDEINVGKEIFKKRIWLTKQCVKNSLIFKYNGYKVAIFNDPDKLTSDVSEELRATLGINVIAGFNYIKESTNDLTICFALRSDDIFNVGDMAHYHGGGGHDRSAGFSQPMDLVDSNPFLLFKDIFKNYVKESNLTKLS